MDKKNQRRDPDVDRRNTSGKGDVPKDEEVTDLRKANENIRNGQGEDAGQRPAIDRHR
jgi:hypothetical protein